MITEICKIIQASQAGNKEKALAYATLLAENMEKAGQVKEAVRIRRAITGEVGNPVVLDSTGEILNNELKARGLKQREFALQIGVHKTIINEVITGKRGIGVKLALTLEQALDIPAMFWLNAQANYELAIVRRQLLDSVDAPAVARMRPK